MQRGRDRQYHRPQHAGRGRILDVYLARTGKIALAAIAKLERGKA